MNISTRVPRPDTPKAMMDDAEVLHQAVTILRARSATRKWDDVADQVRHAAVELISRSRHPSRQHLEGGRMYQEPAMDERGSVTRMGEPGE